MLIAVILLSIVLVGIIANLLTTSTFFVIVRNIGKGFPSDALCKIIPMNLFPFIAVIFFLSIWLKPIKHVDTSELEKEELYAERKPKEN